MRENGFRAIGGLAQRLTSGMAKGRGASLARLRADWTAVVGPELARTTQPEALVAARGARSARSARTSAKVFGNEGSGNKSSSSRAAGAKGATGTTSVTGAKGVADDSTGKLLRLRVSGAAALEVQHRSGQIVERVNAYFGYRMIDDLRLVQGIIAQPAPPRPTPRPDPAIEKAIAERTAEVRDPDLRAALARLGARIATGRRTVLVGALGALFLHDEARAQAMSPDKLLGVLPDDHVLGKPDAPNILIDYASLTCPHCANFNAAVMPVLRREWIDSGKMRLIYRHFPSDAIATRASLLAECGGPDKFFGAVDTLFRTQVQWMTAPDPAAELLTVLAPQGLTAQAAEACVANDRLLDKVIADVQSGQMLGVRFTPTMFINEQNYGNPGGADAIAAILGQVGR